MKKISFRDVFLYQVIISSETYLFIFNSVCFHLASILRVSFYEAICFFKDKSGHWLTELIILVGKTGNKLIAIHVITY